MPPHTDKNGAALTGRAIAQVNILEWFGYGVPPCTARPQAAAKYGGELALAEAPLDLGTQCKLAQYI